MNAAPIIKQVEIAAGTLSVSELGLGCASLAGIFSPVSRVHAMQTLQAARDAGITYFDTAPFYGHGLSERRVGDALRDRSGVVLSSKVGRLMRRGASTNSGAWVSALPFTPVFDYSYDGIMRSFEDSTQRLGCERIDLLYIHDIGTRTHGDAAGQHHFEVAMSGGYSALADLKACGAIRAFGLGVNEAAVCEAALNCHDWDVFLLAGRYTLLEQAPLHGLMKTCAARGTDIIVGGPFNSGVLVGGAHFDYGAIPQTIAARVQAISKICDAHGVSLAAAALQFPLAHPAVKSVIPGPRSTQELAQILNWWSQEIPTALWSDLQADGLIDPLAPVPD